MKNGNRKLVPGDSFPVYLSWVYVIFKKILQQFSFEPNFDAGTFKNFVCTVLKLEKMKNNKINNDFIAKYNL